MSVVTDTHEFSITVILHGNAVIENVVVPIEVEKNTPFMISYDCKNQGALVPDTLWGHIKDANEQVLDGSYWEEEVAVDESVHKEYTHPGIDADASFKIEVGYKL